MIATRPLATRKSDVLTALIAALLTGLNIGAWWALALLVPE